MSDNIRLSDGTEGKPEDLAAFFNLTGTSPIGAKVVSVHPLWIISSVLAFVFLSFILIFADLDKSWHSAVIVLIFLDIVGAVIAMHLKWEKKIVSLGSFWGAFCLWYNSAIFGSRRSYQRFRSYSWKSNGAR